LASVSDFTDVQVPSGHIVSHLACKTSNRLCDLEQLLLLTTLAYFSWEIHLIHRPESLASCVIELPFWQSCAAASALCARRSRSAMLLEVILLHWHRLPRDDVYHIVDVAMLVDHEVLVTRQWLLDLRSIMTTCFSFLL
jgi:hypothetical protein